MDTGKGVLAEISEERAEQLTKALRQEDGVFHVGQEVNIRGSKFRITKIMRNRMVVKLLVGQEKKGS